MRLDTRRPPFLASTAVAVAVFLVLLAGSLPAASRKNRAPEPEQNPQTYFQEGLLYYNEGQIATARDRFERAVELEPKYHEALYMLGITYFHLADLEKAEKTLRQVLDINPFFTDAHNILGMIYDQQGQMERAIAEWNIVLSDQNFPQPWNPAFNIGKALASRGNHEEAVVWFKRAVDLKKDWYRAWFQLGLSLEEIGNLQEAKESYEKALDLVDADNPSEYLIRFRAGLTSYKMGQNVLAKEYFSKVVSERPETPEGKKAAEFLALIENRPATDSNGLPRSLYR